MRSLLEHYQVLVGELALDPGRRVADVPWIGSAEDALLADWENGPALDCRRPRSGAAADPRTDRGQRGPAGGYLRRRAPGLFAVREAGGRHRAAAERGRRNTWRSRCRLSRSLGGDDSPRWSAPTWRAPLTCRSIRRTRLSGMQYLLQDAAVAAVITTKSLRERLPPGPWQTIAVDAMADGAEVAACDAGAARRRCRPTSSTRPARPAVPRVSSSRTTTCVVRRRRACRSTSRRPAVSCCSRASRSTARSRASSGRWRRAARSSFRPTKR